MRTTLVVFFILSQVTLHAQHRVAFKFNPLYLLDYQKYVMPLGIEYGYGNFSIQGEQMLMITKDTDFGLRENLNYSKINLQFRYYVDNISTGGSRGFVGLHGTTRNYDFLESSGSYISSGGRKIRHRNSTVELQDFGAYAIGGVQVQSGQNIIFEMVVGYGIRELSVKHNPEEITFVEYLDPILFDDLEPQWREGTRTLPGLLVQMRFGYMLVGKKKG